MEASIVQYGRRRGSSKKESSNWEENRKIQPLDLRKVTVLPKAEWLRIQDNLNQVNKYQQSIRETAQEREALHLPSEEVATLWPNTLAAQRQLEAKKIKEELEEKQRQLIDIEEAKYQAQMRKEAIENAKAQQFYQTDRVKGFHSALMMTEVLKERETQIELKRRIQSASKDKDKEFVDMLKIREEEASRQEQQKALQKEIGRQAAAGDLKKQMKEYELSKEQEKLADKEEGAEIQRLCDLYLWEQSMEKQKQLEQKRSIMQDHQESVANRDAIKAIDTQKQAVEEEQRKLYLAAKQKMTKLRKEKEAEISREAQAIRDRIRDKLTATQQQQVDSEDERIAKAIAEREARQARHQLGEDLKKAAMLSSIAAHREAVRQEQVQRDLEEQQKSLEALQAKKEAEKIFLESQQLKAQKMKESEIILQDLCISQMEEKRIRNEQLRRELQEFQIKNAELIFEEERQFQHYANKVITAAEDANRNIFPLRKAAREGIGGGLGPLLGGLRPSYQVQDSTGNQMPKYITGTTQNIKELNEAIDIQAAKKRLGFIL